MFNKATFLTILVILLSFITGCATEAKKEAVHYPPHSHQYPFTEVMGEYHIRLEVEHAEEKMFLIFEDASEKPIKLLHLRSIKGEVVFHDDGVKEVIFRPSSPILHKHISSRLAGTYVAYGEWLKTTPAFTLHVVLHFQGERHELTFDYKMPSGEIETPYHRRGY